MKMRALFLATGFLIAALPAAACNMDVHHRGVTVADYVETVQPCLRRLAGGLHRRCADGGGLLYPRE
jgi:hypothetical protein